MADRQLRWTIADEPRAQATLFEDPIVEREPGRGEFRGMEFLHVRAKRIINHVAGAPFGFEYTINAYRGCSHACVYCFARPTHAYLDLDIDEDFDRKIVVKVNAVERLRAELQPRTWGGHLIAMGTNTDPYQRCEGKYRLTRGIIETLIEFANPFSILTKSTLVLRDKALLREANDRMRVRVDLSIGTLDEEVWKATEPGTPHPRQRVRAVEQLNEAGIPCGVLIAPILPGLSDAPEQVDEVTRACRDAGAVSVVRGGLRLKPGVKEVYYAHLAKTHPHLVDYYKRLYGTRVALPSTFRRSSPTYNVGGARQNGRKRPPDQLNLL
jgi:DNA repair photolyase